MFLNCHCNYLTFRVNLYYVRITEFNIYNFNKFCIHDLNIYTSSYSTNAPHSTRLAYIYRPIFLLLLKKLWIYVTYNWVNQQKLNKWSNLRKLWTVKLCTENFLWFYYISFLLLFNNYYIIYNLIIVHYNLSFYPFKTFNLRLNR